jgi:ankyrin repeat protein
MPAVPGSGAHDQWSAFTHERTRDALERMRTTEDARHDALASTCDTRLNAEDEYGDGDQKPILNLLKGIPLRELWSSSGDLFEKLDGTPCGMSPFWVACFNGDAAAVRRHIDDCRQTERSKRSKEDPPSSQPPSELTRLLEKRESMLRYPPLHAVVKGARCLPSRPAASFVDAAAALVAAGARVDSRDVAGHTALAKCTDGVDTTDACLMIAVDVLGPAGADANLANRFGETPIGAAVLRGNVGCLSALLELGADPALNAGSGDSALSMCHGVCAKLVSNNNEACELFSLPVWKEGGCVGKKVVLAGVAGAAGAALNGKVGTVTRLDPRKGKFEVEVEVDETAETDMKTEEGLGPAIDREDDRETATEKKKKKRPKTRSVLVPPRRLELAEKLVGAQVKLRGLVARADLNGRVGACVRFVAARCRYEVALAPDGGAAAAETVNVRPENAQLLREGTRAAMTCAGCGAAPGKAVKLKYCTRCWSVSYCGKACGDANWDAHKPACRARAAHQIKVDVAAALAASGAGGLSEQSVSYATGELFVPGAKAPTDGVPPTRVSSQFVVKVQISPRASSSAAHFMAGAMIYDASRETNFILKASAFADEFARAEKAVEEQGIPGLNSAKGVKAYFNARFLEGRKILMIDLERAVDPPAW